MTERVGVRELRQQASAILRRVRDGETIDITDRGRPIARLVPHHERGLAQLVREGRAIPPTTDLRRTLGDARLPVSGAGSPSAALAELRADER